MHIIDGDLLKSTCNQCSVLHIQHLIEQHHKKIIQKFLPFQTAFTPHKNHLRLSIAHFTHGRNETVQYPILRTLTTGFKSRQGLHFHKLLHYN